MFITGKHTVKSFTNAQFHPPQPPLSKGGIRGGENEEDRCR